jgi:hypothetical protein
MLTLMLLFDGLLSFVGDSGVFHFKLFVSYLHQGLCFLVIQSYVVNRVKERESDVT